MCDAVIRLCGSFIQMCDSFKDCGEGPSRDENQPNHTHLVKILKSQRSPNFAIMNGSSADF